MLIAVEWCWFVQNGRVVCDGRDGLSEMSGGGTGA